MANAELGKFELYNLRDDVRESKNLAEKNSDPLSGWPRT